ncbi:zinc ribbon domain-containing protein [Chitinispirillales bacterium ANBcel5]|uniref:zinc ribbon domain-containing protein n=1 Tax=Cellulosispirillum alkaliphilum TaxID=3039283 RepID=UPI002A56FA1C|nr:zinc ribbon domain-containing protein [Chitinispirillales bacterium ANBcel5]
MAKQVVPCPYCGEDILSDASACPHCGSDERTGWSDQSYMDGIDLVDEEMYEEIRRKEFGTTKSSSTKVKLPWRTIIGALVLLAFILAIIL